MAVFNGAPFLREAIQSILSQTFTDFEFLIINDGSTDSSLSIVNSYADPRIKLVNNDTNKGLIASLNIGITLSSGEFVARMDCDDISLPERLSKQIEFLDSHPECSMVAVKCRFINAAGEECGVWNDDSNFASYDEIVQRLPRTNCIAHPGIMIRSGTLSTYRYDPRQLNSEDYDLWLRLVADGHRIEKLDEYLLKYRLSTLSVTYKSNMRHPDLKNLRTKGIFCLNRIKGGKLNIFTLKVLCSSFKDLYYFLGKLVLGLLTKWVAGFGRALGGMLPFRNRSNLFFFFPFCHIGGAERVHADIVNCFAAEHPWLFFCKWSPRPGVLRADFDKAARTFNLSLLLKYTYPLSAGFMAGFINRHPNGVVFGCNTLFFYKMLPYLSKNIRAVDLLHAFGGGAEEFSLPVVHHLDKRVVITAQTRNDLTTQYNAKGIDSAMCKRIELIENRVTIPTVYPGKPAAEKLNILFVGRNSEEKRVHIVGRVAALCLNRGIPVMATMVGADLIGGVAGSDRPFCNFTGEVTDPRLLRELYERAHLLLLTSSREGFPMVIMEAMAEGVVPIATNVGGISRHLKTGVNGWLIENSPVEAIIVEAMFAQIEKMSKDRDQLMSMSRSAYHYARDNFGGERFCGRYRSIILDQNDSSRNSNA